MLLFYHFSLFLYRIGNWRLRLKKYFRGSWCFSMTLMFWIKLDEINEASERIVWGYPFWLVLRLPECQYQGQILHHIRELKQPNLEELWFFVAHKPRRFGIAKFSLITSLNCFGDLDKTRFKLGDDGFKEKYFNYYLKITKAILESVFIQSNFMNDQDAVNMVVLYLNNNYLFFF